MKGGAGKSKEELALEKRMELERRLQDVSGQLNSVKKPTKPKGASTLACCLHVVHWPHTVTMEKSVVIIVVVLYGGTFPGRLKAF